MEKFNEDSLQFDLAGNDDYDEYEEEIIERDEYVDEDSVDEESYEDDGEYYDEEPYDDGYYADEEYPFDEYGLYDNAPVENDKLNKVLDELAELKRSVAPAPYHPYASPPGGIGPNDLSLYNEISRLRDELGKTQSSQEMHVELNRIKEQAERDARHNEAMLLGEIRRLNERIEQLASADVKKNDETDRLEAGQSEAAYAYLAAKAEASAAEEAVLREEFKKLVEINEAILNAVKDTEHKSLSQIAEIKKRVASLPDFAQLAKKVDELRRTIGDLENTGNTSLLVGELQQLKGALDRAPEMLLSAFDAEDVFDRIDGLKTAVSGSDNNEILRQLYELKAFIGTSNVSAAKRNAAVLGLYNDLNRVRFDAESNMLTLAEKLNSIDAFAKKLSLSSEPEAYAISGVLTALSQKVLSVALTGNTVEEIKEFAMSTGSAAISLIKQEAAANYAKLAERIRKNAVLGAMELLPELLDAVNVLQDGATAAYNGAIYEEMLRLADECVTVEGDAAAAIADKIADKFETLACLTAADFVDYAPVRASKIYKAPVSVAGSALFDRLDELKNILSDLNFVSDYGADGEKTNTNGIVLAEIAALKNEIYTTLNQDEMLNTVSALKQSVCDVAARIDEGVAKDLEGQLDALYEDLADDLNETSDTLSAQIAALQTTVAEVAEKLAQSAAASEESAEEDPSPTGAELNLLVAEVVALRDEIQAYRDADAAEKASVADDAQNKNAEMLNALFEEVNALRNEAQVFNEEILTLQKGDTEAVLDGVGELKEIVATRPDASGSDGDSALSDGLNAVLEEVSGLKECLNDLRKEIYDLRTDRSATIENDIQSIKDMLAALSEEKSAPAAPDNTAMLFEEIEAIKDELIASRAPASDGNTADSLALLTEEVSALKEQIVAQPSVSGDKLFKEIQELRDQLFVISMANVSKDSAEPVYEAYNNLIFDEMNVVRKELTQGKFAEALAAISAELASIRDSVEQNETLTRLQEELASVKESANNEEVLARLQDELSALRAADESIVNFMSGIVSMLEGQSRDTEGALPASGVFHEEIEGFKREIAAAVAESSRESAVSTTQEISKLKEELIRKKSTEDASFLQELQRIQTGITSLTREKEKRIDSEKDLSRSLFDLRAELNQIADFVSEAEVASAAEEKASGTKKDAEPPAKHSGGKKKSVARIEALLEEAEKDPFNEELFSKIHHMNEESHEETVTTYEKTDELYVASNLAKQVANKLIIEQLLQQLGDGYVPQSEVEEIARDILPQEFSAVQPDDQNDKVRRLANSLVLDKLRARLTGKK